MPGLLDRVRRRELLALASARRADRDPSAQDLANRLAEKRLEEVATTEALRVVDESLVQYAQALTALTEARSKAAAILQQLAEAGAPDGAQDDEVLASLIAGLESQLENLDDDIERSSSLDELREAAARVAEAARRAALIRRRTDNLAVAETAKSVLRLTPGLWMDEGGFLVDLAAASAAADQELAGALKALEAARAEAEARRLVAGTAPRKLADDVAPLDEGNRGLNLAIGQRQTLVTRWLEGGMSGEPDPARLTTLIDGVSNRLQTLTAMMERQRQLTARYRRWTQDEALRNVRRRIVDEVAGATPPERSERLHGAVNAAQADLDRAQRARRRMEALVVRMQTEADNYAERVLEPLNGTIQRFSRALMMWSDAAIVYQAEHMATRAELRPRAVRTEPDGQITPLDINPNYYFSEGQLSALSVSALLAASTSFRWSRWRGLLLDDPLQHNDVIHASAFMDMVRQLVRLLGYQVIMSTHDSAEAAFLVRKCQSANIPYRVHELAPPGEDGLVSAAA